MFFIWVVLAGLMQVTLFRWLNLLAVLAVFSGLRKGPIAGFLMGAVAGLCAAIFSGTGIALNLALYSGIGAVSGISRAHIFYKEDIFLQFAFSFCGVLLFYIAYFFLTGRIHTTILPSVFFSALVSPVLFKIVKI